MRSCVVTFLALLVACAGPSRAWVPTAPIDLAEGDDAFVLVGLAALQLANVEVKDGELRGTVVHAWELPPAGVAAIPGEARTMSPQDIARRAGWSTLPVARQRIRVPLAEVRDARAGVEPEPDDDAVAANDGDPSLLASFAVEVAAGLLDWHLCGPCASRCGSRATR